MLVVARAREFLAWGLGGFSPEYFEPRATLGETSALWAKRFWGTAPEIVMASRDDAEAVILGSALGAQLAAPLVIYDARDNESALPALLSGLGVRRLLVATSREDSLPSWASRIASHSELLGREALLERTVKAIGAEKVRTVVLARLPGEEETGQTSWLAPYVSAVRGAPVVLCRSASADEAEARVNGLIGSCRLRPRSVTIVADYRSIGTHEVKVPAGADPSRPEAAMGLEPCLPDRFEATAWAGVGRIPFAGIEEASTLLARGLARRRLLAGHAPRAVMVANPILGNAPLPLCETVSRLTAAEFRNCRIAIDEFYRRPADSAEVLAAAKSANVIFYEGHIEHQDLFPTKRSRAYGTGSGQGGAPAGDRPGGAPLPNQARHGEAIALDGVPIVILQTCGSLRTSVLKQVYASGGVAVIGTSTPVHSTSGSAFAKALSDGALYRGATLGEAFRDARNYFFCLQDLKKARAHEQEGKSQRVALSFRLWGDPELEFFPEPRNDPAIAPVSAIWSGNKLIISLPPRRLPEVRNEEYVARMFPGSEAAGMVLHAEGESARRVAPFYFFVLPVPKAFAAKGPAGITHGGKPTERVVFRSDPLGRFCYLLYYPSGEKPGEPVILEFLEQPRRSSG